MRATYFGEPIGRFDSSGRGKTELCAAVVETLTRQMIGNLKRVIYRTCQFSIRLSKDKKYANRFKNEHRKMLTSKDVKNIRRV